ncbi:MAG TPA: hypothetical protein VFF80_03730 [Bacillota bacterium]|nr:hypothetical protein [Bacillota bacterium]
MKTLKGLAITDCRFSTGMLSTWQGRLVFALSQPSYWQWEEDGSVVIHCIGIGGGLEGAENFSQAVAREAIEEASVPVDLREPPGGATLYLSPTEQLQTISGPWSDSTPAPLFLWQKQWIVCKPGKEPYFRTWFTPVYWGEFAAEPQASMENMAIIQVPPELFPNLLQPRLLTELEKEGLILQGHDLPARDKIKIGLSGTAYYLAECWDQLQDLIQF